jgi:tetratricopeptide (TPR) repeat protein
MAFDAYAPCPCGSGKKFKWCCHGVMDDMEKIAGLQESHQVQATLLALDRLEKSKPDTPWIYVTRAGVLLNEGRSDEARAALEKLLEMHPEHPFGQALFATASLAADGLEEAKPAIYRALRHSAGDFPDIVGSLALGIAGVLFGRQKYLACRQHLALAMRLLPDEDKQEVFLRLLEFDGNDRIPYPLRSAHPVQPYQVEGDEDRSKLLRRAERSAVLGCFETAAHHYAQLAEGDPDNAALRINEGLCRAWDGDEAAAAEALHRAAALTEDFDEAVEYETLAQLLDQNHEDAQAPITATGFRVGSVGRLLSILDDDRRFARVPIPPDEQEQRRTLVISVLDRPLGEPETETGLDTVANVLGRLVVNESAAEDAPQVWLTGVDGEAVARAGELFDSVAGELIESREADDSAAALRAFTPRELLPLQYQWHFPAGTPAVRQQELEAERWRKNVEEIWPSLPQKALGGKTPSEAAGDESLRVPLAASVYCLDAFCDRNGHILDVAATWERLGLARPGVIEVTDDLPLGSLSVMKLHRLPVERLADDQLMYVLNRALLLRHNEFLDRVLKEALSRQSCHQKIDLDRAYFTLSELARDRYERTEALDWIRKGTEHAATGEEAFVNTLRWEMRELSLRVEDPADPQLMPHVRHVLDRYAKKIPRLAEHVRTVLAAYGVRAPERLEVAGVGGHVTESGLWTPGDADAGEQKKKLWLPGED